MIWLNPPYSVNIVTKVGKHFLSLLGKHFPPHTKFHKIFNRNTIKISYSCLPNMKAVHTITKLNIPRPPLKTEPATV